MRALANGRLVYSESSGRSMATAVRAQWVFLGFSLLLIVWIRVLKEQS